jgi:hypothetical protein
MQIQRLECDLHDSAPVEIDDFVREMNLLFEKNRFEIQSSEHAGKLNVLSMKRGTVSRSNAAAIHARLRAIQEAVAAAEALKFEFVIPVDLTARLDLLRKGVLAIAIDKYEEVTREPFQQLRAEQARYA